MTHGDLFFEHAAAATGNEFPTPKRDHFFQQTGCQRRADAWVKEGKAPPVV